MKIKLTITLDSAKIGDEISDDATTLNMLRRLRDDPADLQRDDSGGDLRTWLCQTLVEYVPASSIATVHLRGWVAGWNMPGYLPDTDPAILDTRRQAVQYLMDELRRAAEERDEHSEAYAMYSDAIERLRLLRNDEDTSDEGWVQCGKYIWWFRREEE